MYIELPEECGYGPGMCGKLNYWLYGFRPAAAAWEKHYSELLESIGFMRGISCGVIFYHRGRDVSLAVHGDDFTFCGSEEDLWWIRDLMKSWFEIKVRAVLGPEPHDDKEVTILGRIVKWTERGLEYEADPRHRKAILEYFGFAESAKPGANNGVKDKVEDWESEPLDKQEAKEYRGLAARLNFLSLDCPDLQFSSKPSSREMANPTRGSWKLIKKVARYLVNVEKIVWVFEYQDEPRFSHSTSDSDWGGSSRDRKSTSGGVWMLGKHCIKTWSATQGAYALSSAEAEFYSMIEAVTRSKALCCLARELGFEDLSNVIHLGTDSSAAKSFVSRRGLGKMRHIEIRDLWLQKEVREGNVIVHKVLGSENPADLMTKVLSVLEIVDRLKGMNLEYVKAKLVESERMSRRDISRIRKKWTRKRRRRVYLSCIEADYPEYYERGYLQHVHVSPECIRSRFCSRMNFAEVSSAAWNLLSPGGMAQVAPTSAETPGGEGIMLASITTDNSESIPEFTGEAETPVSEPPITAQPGVKEESVSQEGIAMEEKRFPVDPSYSSRECRTGF